MAAVRGPSQVDGSVAQPGRLEQPQQALLHLGRQLRRLHPHPGITVKEQPEIERVGQLLGVDSGREEPLADHRDAEVHLGGDELLEDDRATATRSSSSYSASPSIRVSRQLSWVAEKALQMTLPRPMRSMKARACPGSLVTMVRGTSSPAARAAGSCQVFIIDSSTERGGLTQVIGRAS
jgi:hypothetical protein